MERADLTGEPPSIDEHGDHIRFFGKRYVNVLFSVYIRPLLQNRGRTLTRAELQDSIATDQALHENIVREHNDVSR